VTKVTATQVVRAGQRVGERLTGREQDTSAARGTVEQVVAVATRVMLVPPQALLRWRDRRLPVLTGGARVLPQRQQTLRHVLAR
jgi:predicted ATPase